MAAPAPIVPGPTPLLFPVGERFTYALKVGVFSANIKLGNEIIYPDEVEINLFEGSKIESSFFSSSCNSIWRAK